MGNHDILSPSLQKYYSALKCLNDFGRCGNLFDDISRLDSFFSEFRNITFVIQKGLQSEENKKAYNDLRDKYLTGETLRWFVDTRNKTTKQKPFALKKELIIDIYLPNGLHRLRNENFIVDFDDTFEKALDFIKNVLIDELGLVEIFFSSKVRFIEDGSDVDLYPLIKSGLIQMTTFLNEIRRMFPCDCEVCTALNKAIEPLYKNAIYKDINFVSDYAIERDKALSVGEKTEMFIGFDDFQMPISDMRISLDNPIYEKVKDCIPAVFCKFISYHVAIYQMQRKIMPVFMVVYSDNTYRNIPFVATTKTTFYRKVYEIVEHTNFTEVEAVFYCGEYYEYDSEQFEELNERPYLERIELAKKESLFFTMLLKSDGEKSVYFDIEKIDDMEYIVSELRNMDRTDIADEMSIDWLYPIKERLSQAPQSGC